MFIRSTCLWIFTAYPCKNWICFGNVKINIKYDYTLMRLIKCKCSTQNCTNHFGTNQITLLLKQENNLISSWTVAVIFSVSCSYSVVSVTDFSKWIRALRLYARKDCWFILPLWASQCTFNGWSRMSDWILKVSKRITLFSNVNVINC